MSMAPASEPRQIELYSGPCDGETRTLDPEADPSFLTIPLRVELGDSDWMNNPCVYQYDKAKGKYVFKGRQPMKDGKPILNNPKQPWESQPWSPEGEE
jgi:hypothetical protein